MKIVYCIDSLSYLGGIPIVTIRKANALAQVNGNQVWIVVTDTQHPPIEELAKNVALINLSIGYFTDDWKGFYYVLKGIFVKRRRHKEQLGMVLNDIQPDVVISPGRSEKYFLPTLKIHSNPVFIRELHYVKNYRMDYAVTFKQKLMAWASILYDYHWKIRAYDKIVVLSPADKSGSWKHWDKVTVVPNFVNHTDQEPSPCTAPIAASVGRLAPEKNFDVLIRVWAKVVERHPEWVLQVWGTGQEEESLKALIAQLDLSRNVHLMGYSGRIQEDLAQASLFVFASKAEGFGLAVLEGMSVGVPAVLYDCPGGLRYVVKDGETGVFVPMGDEDALAAQVCRLIEDEPLRQQMGSAAVWAAQNYEMERTIDRWMALFEEEWAKKHRQKHH